MAHNKVIQIANNIFPGRRWLICGYLLLIAASVVVSGCWDRVEIQDRSFVLAMAIDVAEAPHSAARPEARVEWYVQGADQPRPFRFSLQVLKLGSRERGGGEPSKTFVLSNTGNSIFETLRDTLGQSSKALWFEHNQAVIISEAAARRGGLSRVMDFWQRDAEMRWRMSLFVSRGEAAPLLDFTPPSGEPGGIYLANVARRHVKDSHLATAATDLLFTTESLDAKGDLALPVLELAGKALKIKGAALFKKGNLVGYIDEYAIQGVRFIRGVEKDVVITAPDPDNLGEFVVFEVFRHDTKIKPHVDGDNIYFTLDIAMRGNIGEISNKNKLNALNTEELRRMQTFIVEEVKRNIMYGQAAVQAKGTDILYFGKLLKAEEPKIWARVKDNWDTIFPTIPLYVSVNVSIINIGEHK